jgi:hypothetical protein
MIDLVVILVQRRNELVDFGSARGLDAKGEGKICDGHGITGRGRSMGCGEHGGAGEFGISEVERFAGVQRTADPARSEIQRCAFHKGRLCNNGRRFNVAGNRRRLVPPCARLGTHSPEAAIRKIVGQMTRGER